MKKTLQYIVVTLIMLCSCSNNTTKNNLNENMVSTDSIVESCSSKLVANNAKPNRTDKRLHTLPDIVILQDNLPNMDDFTSNDRQTFNLRGNVKECKNICMYSDGTESIKEHLKFDKRGKFENNYGYEIKRNSKGYIFSLKYKEGFGGQTFFYDKEGRVTKHTAFEESGSGEFFYKYLGYNPLESYLFGEVDYDTGEFIENGSNYPYSGYSYKYLKYDNHGNWTLRNVIIEEFEGEPKVWTYKEKRVIVYY